jgi:uncharacterized membrane protein YbhN (UPF0104 family)
MKLRKIPRGTFLVGGLSAVGLAVPLLTAGLYGLTARLGWGARQPSIEEIFIITLAFAGVPALLTGGGVARLVAHRMAEQSELTVGRAMRRGAVAFAVAGIALAVLAAVPLAVLPERPQRWVPLALLGLAAGAVTGAATAVLVGLRQRRHRARRQVAETATV